MKNNSRSYKIRQLTGLSRLDFCKKYDIPLRTVENWDCEKTVPPKYVLDLLEKAVRADFNIDNSL